MGPSSSRHSRSLSTDSGHSAVSSLLESINDFAEKHPSYPHTNADDDDDDDDDVIYYSSNNRTADSSTEFLNGRLPQKSKANRRLWKILFWTFGMISILVFGSVLVLFSSLGTKAKTSVAHSSLNSTEDVSNLAGTSVQTDKRLFDMNSWRQGDLNPTYKPIHWVSPAPGDEQTKFIEESAEGFVLVNWPDRDNKTFLMEESQRVFRYKDQSYFVHQITISPDHKYLLLATNYEKNYRHSSYSSYFIADLETKKPVPLIPDQPRVKCALAIWSPKSDKVSFVLDNNLYIRNVKATKDEDAVRKVTTDGGSEIFYGRPDWVYEEEVFQGDTAMWWSPKGDYLAFLRTNDSAVEEFPIPYFLHKGPAKDPYPQLKKIKYPKPGTPNPIVDLLLLDTNSQEVYHVPVENKNDTEKLITEVIWTGDEHLIMRMTNRESDVLKVGVIDAKTREGQISRTVDVSGKDGGWFEISQNTQFVPADSKNGRSEDGYIDMIVVDGYNHLGYFSPVWAKEPKAILTSGQWEVEDAAVIFNQQTNRVYFTSTAKSSIERHMYSVKLDGTGLQAITDTNEDGWYSASYSFNNRYALLSYQGPKAPWQKVLDLEAEDIWSSAVALTSNENLNKVLKEFDLPQTSYSQIKTDVDANGKDVIVNVVEHRPPLFDENKKYPVLFYVYGGPVSQMVTKRFSFSFSQVIASSLNAVVVTVDGRGTGFMGRDFRAVVRQKLGHYETKDQISAAKQWAKKSYVDETRMAIWGWSYGGFMTLKTLETDAGQTFSYGMAVAPVTDWRFYDSIYTERYMKTPEQNNAGYIESAISNVTAIGQNERFLLMHGSGDDNVHFQNSLVLLDKFDIDKVENYDMHVFPDSDHSISFHNANRVVYDKLLHWLSDAFSGKFKNFY